MEAILTLTMMGGRERLTLPPAAARAARESLEVQATAPRERREPRPPAIPVDFDFIPGSQREMHDRLENWARSLTNRPHKAVSAGFGLFRSDTWDKRREYGGATAVPVSPEDAQRIAMAVAALAQDTRNDGFRRAKALDWYYRLKCRDAKGTADGMHYSLHGLADCVIAARAALIEAGV